MWPLLKDLGVARLVDNRDGVGISSFGIDTFPTQRIMRDLWANFLLFPLALEASSATS